MSTIRNGTCIDCGCSTHECECVAKPTDDADVGKKMEAYLDNIRNREDVYRCFDCLKHCCGYMVTPAVWKKAWPKQDVHQQVLMFKTKVRSISYEPHCILCFRCLQQRLARKLKIEDFLALPINEGIFLGFEIGKASI